MIGMPQYAIYKYLYFSDEYTTKSCEQSWRMVASECVKLFTLKELSEIEAKEMCKTTSSQLLVLNSQGQTDELISSFLDEVKIFNTSAWVQTVLILSKFLVYFLPRLPYLLFFFYWKTLSFIN